jgi:hypothetical protein
MDFDSVELNSRDTTMRRHLLVYLGFLAALNAGCGADPTEQRQPAASGQPTTAPGAPAAELGANAVLYDIDPTTSVVFWKIGRAGVMARFGHNHVISAEQFSGTVTVDPDNPAASRFELEIPVAQLVVDDPELRSRLGEEFYSVPSAEDIAGTRRNMLSADLLKGDEYSHVRVRGGALRDGTLPVEIEIVGQLIRLDLPGSVAIDDDHVEASGEFDLDHADLGLSPFSALGGALQVAPTIEFSYRIRAVRAE